LALDRHSIQQLITIKNTAANEQYLSKKFKEMQKQINESGKIKWNQAFLQTTPLDGTNQYMVVIKHSIS
jgi:hypothetical protein